MLSMFGDVLSLLYSMVLLKLNIPELPSALPGNQKGIPDSSQPLVSLALEDSAPSSVIQGYCIHIAYTYADTQAHT